MEKILKDAVKIRAFENCLLEFFKEGLISGTVHTCLGQELNAAVLLSMLADKDFVTSNHRGHGHFLARTQDYRGLLAEIMGHEQGVCRGLGGTQHLATKNFLANGVQGGTLPLAVGLAWSKKIQRENSIVVSFIGDGTFGEGVVYESMNIASLNQVPLLVVVENNKIAQSTPTRTSNAGTLRARVEAFDLPVFAAASSTLEDLYKIAHAAVASVKGSGRPAVLIIDTERLGSHSKGDDTRSAAELKTLWENDFLQKQLSDSKSLKDHYEEAVSAFRGWASEIKSSQSAPLGKVIPPPGAATWSKCLIPQGQFWGQELSTAFYEAAKTEPRLHFIGEDVAGDYGGAFKISKKIALKFPERVTNMPISEAAICGVATGMAMGGLKPFAEIMFGDFLTLAADQLVNHAAKFRRLYQGLFSLGVVFRTPMGGYRGYGATHSQSIEKMFLGTPGLRVVSPSLLLSPSAYLDGLLQEPTMPTLAIENKSMYAESADDLDLISFEVLKTDSQFPIFLLKPKTTQVFGTLLCYGGMLAKTMKAAEELFTKNDMPVQVAVITELYPLNLAPLREVLPIDGVVIFVEEGVSFSSLSGEVSHQLRQLAPSILFDRIGSEEEIIPAARILEDQVLPSVEKIVALFCKLAGDR